MPPPSTLAVGMQSNLACENVSHLTPTACRVVAIYVEHCRKDCSGEGTSPYLQRRRRAASAPPPRAGTPSTDGPSVQQTLPAELRLPHHR